MKNKEKRPPLFPTFPDEIHLSLSQRNKILCALKIPESDILLTGANEAQIASQDKHNTDGTYKVTLHSCDCYAFKNKNPNQHPCKHMYALLFYLKKNALYDRNNDCSNIERHL